MTGLLRALILWFTQLPFVRGFLTQHSIGWRVAARFVAGDGLEDGMRVAHELDRQGIRAMLDHLGENVESPAQAAAAADGYIRALKRIRESPEIDCNISVKLTQLGLDISRDLCVEHIDRVLAVAAEVSPPTLVMIDMEASQYVEPTLEVYLELRERHDNVGLAVQSYLYRTADDVRRIAGPRAIVRMTKGAYLEPPEIAHQTRRAVRRAYASLAATLLTSGSTVHFATHDPLLIRGAKSYVRRRGVPSRQYEFQMLYGVRRDIQADLVREGEPVRVYIPYGTEWYPYLTRRLAERPGNLWFFVSNVVRLRG